MKHIKRIHHPATYAVLFIALAEMLLPEILHDPLSVARTYLRNPDFKRNWEEYVDVTSRQRKGDLRVLILSNSQAVGLEYPEDEIFVAQLQRKLNGGYSNGHTPVQITNWSSVGLHSPELITLMARAKQYQPDILLCLLGPQSFKVEDLEYNGEPTRLDMFPSDITDTAWFYRKWYSRLFREHYIRPITFVSSLFAKYWPTYRLRELPLARLLRKQRWLQAFVPPAQKITWFPPRFKLKTLQNQKKLDISGKKPPAALLRMVVETSSGVSGKKYFIFQPHGFDLTGEQDFLQSVKDEFGRQGWEIWDMSHAVPWQQFLKDSRHFTDAGHKTFADSLLRRLQPVLAQMQPARPEPGIPLSGMAQSKMNGN